MTNKIIKQRRDKILEFLTLVGVPVTTKECIDYLNHEDVGFKSNNKASALAATFAILKELENSALVTLYKREGSRDTVWYNKETLKVDNTIKGSHMRAFIYTHYNEFIGTKTASQLISLMEKSSTELKEYIVRIGDRKNVLAMLRGDIARVSLIKERFETSEATEAPAEAAASM